MNKTKQLPHSPEKPNIEYPKWLVAFIILLLASLFSSCKTCKCPAYSENAPTIVEQKV